jgi:hypothetical protein
MTYRERLWAPWWLWLVVVAWPAMLGVAVGAATSGAVGWLIGCGAVGVAVFALWRSTLALTVDAEGFTVGRVHLERQYLGPVASLDKATSQPLRGVDADARAFTALRGWVATSVRVTVVDDRDPTPYWLVATRRPDALAAALESCRTQARAEG